MAPSNVYRTADGADIVIAANADAVYRRLCDAMGRPELAADPRFDGHEARGRNSGHPRRGDRALDGLAPRDGPAAELADHGVPAGKIYTAADMLTDVHYAARNMVLRPQTASGAAGPMAGIVPKFSRTPGEVSTVGPRLGEHTRAVLSELAGVDDGTWDDLLKHGIVAQ